MCISTARHILHNAHHSPDHMFTVRPKVALRSLKSTDASRRRNKAHNVAGTPAAYGLHSTGARWLSPWRRWERERRRRLRTATTPNPLRSRTSAPMPPHVQLSPIYVLLGRPPKGSKANVLLFPSNSFLLLSSTPHSPIHPPIHPSILNLTTLTQAPNKSFNSSSLLFSTKIHSYEPSTLKSRIPIDFSLPKGSIHSLSDSPYSNLYFRF